MERLAEMKTDGIPTYLYRDKMKRLWLVWDDDEALNVSQESLASFMMEHGMCFTDLGFDSIFKLGVCGSGVRGDERDGIDCSSEFGDASAVPAAMN